MVGRQHYFSAIILINLGEMQFYICLGPLQQLNLNNIWVYHRLLEEPRRKLLMTSKIECGGDYKDGKRNFFHKWVEKFLLNLSFRPFLLMQ